MRGGRRCGAVGLVTGLLSLLGGIGCYHTKNQVGPSDAAGAVAVPPPGAVPRELDLITLPPYVIAPPDQLLIEVVQKSEIPDPEFKPDPAKPDQKAPKKKVTDRLPVQPISGPFLVRLDGSVGLGAWGSVPVAGLTLDQAAEAIRNHVVRHPILAEYATDPSSIIVIIDVLAYNSKRYYVCFDGGGAGEQILSFPITGSETVFDAIANVGGLPEIASKRNIWVARRTPHAGQPWQILPVDWVGMTQHGITFTNYQVMPGDRIYVKALRLATIDRTLARILAPVERVFGVTLLGTSVVNGFRINPNNPNTNNLFP